jgi:hypothetical protein
MLTNKMTYTKETYYSFNIACRSNNIFDVLRMIKMYPEKLWVQIRDGKVKKFSAEIPDISHTIL